MSGFEALVAKVRRGLNIGPLPATQRERDEVDEAADALDELEKLARLGDFCEHADCRISDDTVLAVAEPTGEPE